MAVTLTLAEADGYARSDLSDPVRELILAGVLAEIGERLPEATDNARMKRLAMQLYAIDVSFDPTSDDPRRYVERRNALFRDAGWR